jgi:hypothetical protein
MSDRLEANETVPEGIRRIVLEQIAQALQQMRPETRNKGKAVHDARVCFKKIRAALHPGPVGAGDFRTRE